MAVRKVELMISCTDLADLDEFSASDPICVMSIKTFGQWKEIGRTEAIIDTLNPQFTKTFIIDYDRDIPQQVMFSVYDIDSRSTELKHHDFIGAVELDSASLVRDEKLITTTSKSLRIPGNSELRGYIIITGEIVEPTRSKVLFHIGGSGLDKVGYFSRNDVYLELSRNINTIDFHPVHRTEVYRKSQNPRWRPFEINVQKLCNNSMERPIRFSCYHKKSNGSSSLIGHFVTSLRETVNSRGISHDLLDPKKSTKKKSQSAGTLKFIKCQLDMQHTLLDYIRGECMISLTVAIDFTASNGCKKDQSSLHDILPETKSNQYTDALSGLGTLLSGYMISHDMQAFGFGAKWKKKREGKHSSKVDHCFPLNRTDDPTVKGIKGVVEAYMSAIDKVKFSGPTLFTPLLTRVMEYVKQCELTQDKQTYHIMLIVTDGVVNDFDSAINTIIESSHLPMSIVIAGVGPADFTTMEQLFSTPNHILKSHTDMFKKAERDNTYFVLLRKEKYHTGVNSGLAREMMAAVSRQIISFMKSRNIQPNPPTNSKLDPLTSWISNNVDVDVEHSLHRGLSSNVLVSRLSTFSQSTGPSCPTCGTCLSEDSPLFNFTDSIVGDVLV